MLPEQAAVEKAQLDGQYSQANVVILGNTGVGALTALFYWPMTDQFFLGAWLAILFAIQIIRYGTVFKYRASEPGPDSFTTWLWVYAAGTFLTGSCWGILALILITEIAGQDLVILFLALVGLTGGNIATSAFKIRLFIAFSTPVLFPAGVMGFFVGDQVSMTLGAFSIALWLLSWIAIRRVNDSLVSALQLGFQNQSLVKELEQEKEQFEQTNQKLNRQLQQKLSMTKWLASGSWIAPGPEAYTMADISDSNFNETLTELWETAIEQQAPLSMVMLEIDNPQAAEQIKASQQPDQGLAELQSLICSEIRSQDHYLRVSDTEFALLLTNMPASDATSMVNRIRNKIASQPKPLSLNDDTLITLSFGVAGWVPDVTQNSNELVAACRNAKDQSIQQGGNRVNIG